MIRREFKQEKKQGGNGRRRWLKHGVAGCVRGVRACVGGGGGFGLDLPENIHTIDASEVKRYIRSVSMELGRG